MGPYPDRAHVQLSQVNSPHSTKSVSDSHETCFADRQTHARTSILDSCPKEVDIGELPRERASLVDLSFSIFRSKRLFLMAAFPIHFDFFTDSDYLAEMHGEVAANDF